MRLGQAIPDVCLANKQWVKVPEGKACGTTPRQSNPNLRLLSGGAFYPVDGAPIPLGEVSSVDEFVGSHDKGVILVSAMWGNGSTSRLTSSPLLAQTTPMEALNIFSSSGLRVIFSVSSGTGSISSPTLGGGRTTLYLLERPQVSFPPLPSLAPFGVPTPDDWRALWATWDLVALGMIPSEMLHQKPIALRHK